jgi:hypothetical protein
MSDKPKDQQNRLVNNTSGPNMPRLTRMIKPSCENTQAVPKSTEQKTATPSTPRVQQPSTGQSGGNATQQQSNSGKK